MITQASKTKIRPTTPEQVAWVSLLRAHDGTRILLSLADPQPLRDALENTRRPR